MSKMWAGRTSGKTNAIADDFNSSISFDKRLYKQQGAIRWYNSCIYRNSGIYYQREFYVNSGNNQAQLSYIRVYVLLLFHVCELCRQRYEGR